MTIYCWLAVFITLAYHRQLVRFILINNIDRRTTSIHTILTLFHYYHLTLKPDYNTKCIHHNYVKKLSNGAL